MKTFRNIALILVVVIAVLIVSFCVLFKMNLRPVDRHDTTMIEVVIPTGATKRQVGKILKENDLIRNNRFFDVYVKLFSVGDFKASVYQLSRSMDLKEIIEILEKGNSYNPNQIAITFKEGINIRQFATLLAEKTNNEYESVLALLKNEKYLDELIEKYWFLEEDIKNEKLYYSLEGYLFPDTYYFANEDVSIQEVIAKMLDRMGEVLSSYREEIEKSPYSFHEILTMASILEKEGKTQDFAKISSVFYNRLQIHMSLGSCATAYYGMGIDFDGIGIATNEMMNNDNLYNTYVITTLPLGPISLPGEKAIEAAIHPEDSTNLYFLSDNQGNTYFFETYAEHQAYKQKLIQEGKWNR